MSGAVSETTELQTIVTTVLCVARLGEADRRGWWASHGFGAAGRVVLGQRMPRTWRAAATELDVASAANRHDEVIDRAGAVHLFSDRWPVRRWASAWVAEQKTAEHPDPLLEWLETATDDDLCERLAITGAPTGEEIGQAVRLGTVELPDHGEPADYLDAVRRLGNAYVAIETPLRVPYLEVTTSS